MISKDQFESVAAELVAMQQRQKDGLKRLVNAARQARNMYDIMRDDEDLKAAGLYQGPFIARQIHNLDEALEYYSDLR